MKSKVRRQLPRLAQRYYFTLSMACLIEDGSLPACKVGRAVRFGPLEWDHAIKALRCAPTIAQGDDLDISC